MNRLLLTLLIASLSSVASAQTTLPALYPIDKLPIDLSTQRQKDIERRDQLLAKEKPTIQEQKELQILLERNEEIIENIWNITTRECSWYCGGGNYMIKASSYLINDKGTKYEAKLANDLSYKTAWVEGKEGEGIGEYLEYFFTNKSPRITQIILSNGYVKSETVWKENNRVKKLKLYVNGKPYSVLHLADSRDDQVFDIGKLGRNKNGTDLVLRFEILEVYKGLKDNDTAITEIYFNGIDVH